MTSSKSTKRALVSSALAILMCVAMLIGTTFAWFTDSVTNTGNKIQAGTLDIEVEYRTSLEEDWKTLDNATDLFGAEGTLFEPGHTRVVELKITNAGNLALKYKIGMNIVSETAGTNKAGNPYKLSDYLKVATTGIQQYPAEGGIAEAMEWAIFQKDNYGVWTERDFANFELETDSNGNVHSLQPGAAQILGIKVYMPETVGNEANAKTPDDAASINIGLNVVATQYTYEEDGFGSDQYDKDATYPVVVSRNELNTSLTLDALKDENGKVSPVEVTLGDTSAEDINYNQNNSGYTGKGVMLGSTNLNKYAATPAAAGEYKFTFKDGTINSAANGYGSIDNYKDTSVYMLVPGNSDVVFENMTFNGVVSFDIQKYTSPWSNLNSISFKNCTFNGIIIGTCPASNVTFDGCTFNAYTNADSANNSNPIWWREDTEGSGANANPIETFTFVNNKVTGTRPVKIERIGKTVSPIFTIKNNFFDISAQAGNTETKNMAINIGMGENPNLPFTLIDEGNTISANTAALYTASLTGGSNWYKEISGMKVLDGNGNNKVITALVWKTTTNETFELKTVD